MKISQVKLKSEVNRRIFNEFMKVNSEYFEVPTKSHYDEVYLSKGKSIRLSFSSFYPPNNPSNTIRYDFKSKKNVSKNFFGVAKTTIIEHTGGPHNIITESNEKEYYLIDERDKLLFENLKLLHNLYLELKETVRNEFIDELQKKQSTKVELENLKKKELKDEINKVLMEIDCDSNGVVDIVQEDCFGKLLQKHQKTIINIDKSYVHKFIKVSILLNEKKDNIQKLYKSIKRLKNIKELRRFTKIMKDSIKSYNLLLLHSISMLTSLTKENPDLITFYEIYERFDRLKVFNTNHENEITRELREINIKTTSLLYNLGELMSSIKSFEQTMIQGLSDLNYITQKSFSELNDSITAELKSINSSVRVNNLISAIQTYQLYKINRNTKSRLN